MKYLVPGQVGQGFYASLPKKLLANSFKFSTVRFPVQFQGYLQYERQEHLNRLQQVINKLWDDTPVNYYSSLIINFDTFLSKVFIVKLSPVATFYEKFLTVDECDFVDVFRKNSRCILSYSY